MTPLTPSPLVRGDLSARSLVNTVYGARNCPVRAGARLSVGRCGQWGGRGYRPPIAELVANRRPATPARVPSRDVGGPEVRKGAVLTRCPWPWRGLGGVEGLDGRVGVGCQEGAR